MTRRRPGLVLLLAVALAPPGCAAPEEPAGDPLAPFFWEEGAACDRNSQCPTGLCDRFLVPHPSGTQTSSGACAGVPYAVQPWQRSLVVLALLEAAEKNPSLSGRVLDFCAEALDSLEAPVSLRLLCLDASAGLLSPDPDDTWRERLHRIAALEDLPEERLAAAVVLAVTLGDTEGHRLLSEISRQGPEAHRILAARTLTSLCQQGSVELLEELVCDAESRFVRAAVAEAVARCPEPMRRRILALALERAMAFERTRLSELLDGE
ncbi:MAG: hypothetical protein FJ098_06620 [Deltaproteobacteria bacterium]|nr:hypothetical protein [Deltaproteobacteria bacterium]